MLPYPAYHLASDTEDTVELAWPVEFARLNLDGTYLLRGGIAPPAVDAGLPVDGALAIVGHEVRRGLTIVLQEWAWPQIPDVVLDGRMASAGGWRSLADGWRHYGVRSWLWCESVCDMTPHRRALFAVPGLEFGVACLPVAFDLPMALALALAAMQQGRLFAPTSDPARPDSRFLADFSRTGDRKAPSPAVMAVLSALHKLQIHADHWHAINRT